MTVPVSPARATRTKAGSSALTRWLPVGAVSAVGLGLTAFLLCPRVSPITSKPVGVALLVDVTSSMPFVSGGRTQLDPSYLNAVLSLVESSIGYDRRIHIALVASGTSAARDFDIPPAGTDMEGTIKSRKICRDTLPLIRSYLNTVLAGPQSTNTDLVGALERLSDADPNRAWQVLLASDGLQVAHRRAGTLNLERQKVTSENVDRLVGLAAPDSAISGLRGASVEFVVPAREGNDIRFANDLLSTRLFWNAWLEKYVPAASLYSFETYPKPWADAGGCK